MAASSCSGSSKAVVMEVNDNKAGMVGIDKARIAEIIEAASRGSKFYARQAAKRDADAQRVADDRRRVDALSAEALARGERAGDAEIRRAASGAEFGRSHVHVDMDAFYAAVEMLDDPALRSVPMAVGGNDMLSTSNYAARRFGVRAGMPGFIGRKLCPHLVIVPCRFRRYKEVSRQVQVVLADYDPHFSAASLDEAYLDISDHLATRGAANDWPAPEVACQCPGKVRTAERAETAETAEAAERAEESPTAGADWRCLVCPDCHLPAVGGGRRFGATASEAVAELRYRIFTSTGLTASAGIGPNSMVAKICSDFNKPNGQYRVAGSAERVLEFVRPLAVRKVPGIGRVAEQWLQGLGVTTCRDLFERRGALHHLCRPLTFQFYMRVCVGLGCGFGHGDQQSSDADGGSSDRKSISVERTFPATDSVEWLAEEKLAELCDSLVRQMAKADAGLQGRTVTLKLKLDTFEVLTRSQGLPAPTNSLQAIRSAAAALLRHEFPSGRGSPHPRVRLLGVRLSGLSLARPVGGQKRQACLDALLARIDAKGGDAASVTSTAQEDLADTGSDNEASSESAYEAANPLQKETCVSETSAPADDKEAPLPCPVCSVPQGGGLPGLNSHLDFCLSRSAIQSAVSDYATPSAGLSGATRKRTTEVAATDSKRPRVSGGGGRRRGGAAATTGATIDSFFRGGAQGEG